MIFQSLLTKVFLPPFLFKFLFFFFFFFVFFFFFFFLLLLLTLLTTLLLQELESSVMSGSCLTQSLNKLSKLPSREERSSSTHSHLLSYHLSTLILNLHFFLSGYSTLQSHCACSARVNERALKTLSSRFDSRLSSSFSCKNWLFK